MEIDWPCQNQLHWQYKFSSDASGTSSGMSYSDHAFPQHHYPPPQTAFEISGMPKWDINSYANVDTILAQPHKRAWATLTQVQLQLPYPCKLPVGGDAIDGLKSGDCFFRFALNVQKSGKGNHRFLFVAFNLCNLKVYFGKTFTVSLLQIATLVKEYCTMSSADTAIILGICFYL